MKTKILLACLLSCLLLGGLRAQTPRMKPIFNGKNLNGWQVPPDNIWFTAQNGVLSIKNGPEKRGMILWTKKSYKNFVVQADFRMGEGTVDSGIFLRSDQAPNPQIQIGISGSLGRDMTGSPYVPGKGYPVEAQGVADLLNPHDWNTLRVLAIGNTYTVWLNGSQVMTYEGDTEGAVLKGPVGLQLHANRDMAIDFRNIMIGRVK
ncbi:MAG: DUF1080 domain-containing protein [Bacteroidetes bacterium]|nr:MAG: DUF1080 domain-containing protein [Bacteroidota bacterium]